MWEIEEDRITLGFDKFALFKNVIDVRYLLSFIG